MSAEKIWRLDTPLPTGHTHIQITSFQVEVDRQSNDPPTTGWLRAWYTYGTKVAGQYVDTYSNAQTATVDGAEYVALRARSDFAGLTTLAAMEAAVYGVLAFAGKIPSGSFDDQHD